MKNINCPFCIEIETPELSIWNDKRGDLPLSRVLYENKDWIVVPPLGSFVIGGLLIISKEHYKSCGECPIELLSTLDDIILKVQNVLSSIYKKEILFFEHGPSPCGSKGACCVDHAHINIFPVEFNIWEKLPKFNKQFEIKHCNDIQQLKDSEYLWIKDSKSSIAYPVEGMPSQYIRSIITKEYGFSDRWNWQDYLGLDEIKQTIIDLDNKWN